MSKRNPERTDDDFVFLPAYHNRKTAIRIFSIGSLITFLTFLAGRPITKQDHTVHSLRHIAICMRLIKSEGRVNIFNLTTTAGTGVEQIERLLCPQIIFASTLLQKYQTFVHPWVSYQYSRRDHQRKDAWRGWR